MTTLAFICRRAENDERLESGRGPGELGCARREKMVSSSAIGFSASRDDRTTFFRGVCGIVGTSSRDCARWWLGDEDVAQELDIGVLLPKLRGGVIWGFSARVSLGGGNSWLPDSSESLKNDNFRVSDRVRSEKDTLREGSLAGAVDVCGETDLVKWICDVACSVVGCGGDADLPFTLFLDDFF